jgi:hypothetical protein
LRGLAEVTLRTPEAARLRYLNAAEITDVLNMGAHGAKEVIVMQGNAIVPAQLAKLEQERKILYSLTACAAWFGSHAKRLRPRGGAESSAPR